MAETPEQKYNRIAAAVQQTILNNFPNPNRVGCPGDVRLREVAARGTIVEDDDWQHITHCSECYREFLAVKEEVRRAGRRARTLGAIGGTVLLLLVAGAAAYRYLGESRGASGIVDVAFEPATLNLRDSSDTRGDGKDVQRNIPVLPRRPLQLKIILPFGSESGQYQFQFIDPGGRVVQSGEGTATIVKGDTFLVTRLNGEKLAAGAYKSGYASNHSLGRSSRFGFNEHQLVIGRALVLEGHDSMRSDGSVRFVVFRFDRPEPEIKARKETDAWH